MSIALVSKMKMAVGMALMNLARIYPSFLQAICESIQNAIDAGATRIEVRIDRKSRDVYVRDNGSGVSKVGMEKKLSTICISDKEHDDEKFGRHGIGFVSFTGKCKEYKFTTRIPGNTNFAWQWTFNTKRIEQSVDDLDIPLQSIDIDVLADEVFTEETGGCWSSELHVVSYTNNVQWSTVSFDDIKERVLEQYAVMMRARNTKIWVTGCDERGNELAPKSFVASDYVGKPLKAFAVEGDSRTNIRLFLVAKKDKRKGVVSVGVTGDPFRLSLTRFLHSFGPKFRNERLPKEMHDSYDAMKELLTSGRIEGEIINDKAQRMPSRDAFLLDDAAYELVEHLVGWFDERGREYVDETQHRELDVHRQNLGREALQNVNSIISDLPGFREILKEFRLGKVGDAHTPPATTAGKDSQPAINVQKNVAGGSEGRHDGERVGKESAERHIPYTTQGPQGKPRTLVKNDSQGVHLAYEESEVSQALWRFDRETGTLFINSSCVLWTRCEERSDEDVKRLTELVLLQAILLQTVPETHRPVVREYLRLFETPLVTALQESSSFVAPRRELPRAKKPRK